MEFIINSLLGNTLKFLISPARGNKFKINLLCRGSYQSRVIFQYSADLLGDMMATEYDNDVSFLQNVAVFQGLINRNHS